MNALLQSEALALIRALTRIAEKVETLLDQRLAENTERRIHG